LAEKGVEGGTSEQLRLVEAYAGNPLALKIVARTIVELFDGQIFPFLEQVEQSVLLWLAILREPVNPQELLAVLGAQLRSAQVLEAIESLHSRSLIERGHLLGSFTLQSVVMEYVRQTQQRLLLVPMLSGPRSSYPRRSVLEDQLLSLLNELCEWDDDAQGYGPANLLALLRELRGHLRGLDLSQLSLRGVFLQGVEMQDTTLSGASLQETVFTNLRA
jgi:hypothetical protein